MNTKIPIAASAILVAVALTLTGCSSGGLPGTSSGGGSGSSGSGGSGGGTSGGGGSGPTKNYGADDLVTILKKTETARNLSGTIKTNAEIKADQKDLENGQSLTKSLTDAGGKFEPAACGTLLDSLVSKGVSILAGSDWTAATLEASSDIISVGSTSNVAGAQAAMSNVQNVMSQITSQCSSMKITDGSVSIAFNIKKASATTKASTTFAYEEDITIPGSTKVSKTLTIEATYGNLFIGDVALTNPNISEMEANVNAVIDAANG